MSDERRHFQSGQELRGQASGHPEDSRHPGGKSGRREDADTVPSDSDSGCCCGLTGPGGRLRVALLVVAAVVIVGILVSGFSMAG